MTLSPIHPSLVPLAPDPSAPDCYSLLPLTRRGGIGPTQPDPRPGQRGQQEARLAWEPHQETPPFHSPIKVPFYKH